MNSFFASVEQELNPELRGKPVGVVPMLADNTCCIAASYAAKAFGIKTGTRVADARQMCPGIVFVEADHERYFYYHERILKAIEACVPVESVCSIDEFSCQLTGSQCELANAEALAMKIKAAIRTHAGVALTCSIGLAPNRYLAKIAADMKKPDGLTALPKELLPGPLKELKLRDLPGIGPRMEKRLNAQKIYSMEKLLSLSKAELHQAWGSVHGDEIWHLLKGDVIAERPETHAKSLGHSHVLAPELRNPKDAFGVLRKLTTKAAVRLRREKLWASGFDLWIRYSGDADNWSAHAGLVETQDTRHFMRALETLWERRPAGPVYAVGMVLTGLVPEIYHNPTLFDEPKRELLLKVMDQINDRYGRDVLKYG